MTRASLANRRRFLTSAVFVFVVVLIGRKRKGMAVLERPAWAFRPLIRQSFLNSRFFQSRLRYPHRAIAGVAFCESLQIFEALAEGHGIELLAR